MPKDTLRIDVGLDENGLGPQLGPMLVTGARIERRGTLARDDAAFRARCIGAGIRDSKQAGGFHAMRAMERRVLAWFAVERGAVPADAESLLDALSVEARSVRRAGCPSTSAEDACWHEPMPLPAFGGEPTEEDRRAWTSLAADGLRCTRVRTRSLCARTLNVLADDGVSRFDADLHSMLLLIPELADRGRDTSRIHCGRIGSRKRYAQALAALDPGVTVLREEPDDSAYALPAFGTVRFLVDADASEPAVGLASIFGKYLRELGMLRIVRHWQARAPEAPDASGYHDPVTDAFVKATALARRAEDIPDDCFTRRTAMAAKATRAKAATGPSSEGEPQLLLRGFRG